MSSKVIYGIDFGTSTTLVSHHFNNVTDCINIAGHKTDEETVIQLIVPLTDLDELSSEKIETYGTTAWTRRHSHTDRTYFNFKPNIGEEGNEDKLAELWLKWIYRKIVYQNQGADISGYDYVIGVPAKWDNERVSRYRIITKKSGFKNVHFVPEPIAAILSSDTQRNETPEQKANNRHLLFFDFGGGTLDLSLIELCTQGTMRFKYTGGNPKLGGRDFDIALTNHISEEAQKSGLDLNDEDRINIEIQAKNIKHDYDVNDSPFIIVKNKRFKIDKTKFQEVCKELYADIKSTLDCFFKELSVNNIHVTKDNISEIIKIGGASSLFFIKDLLERYFHKDILINTSYHISNAQHAVVKGLPLYLTKREAFLEQKRESVRNKYDAIKVKLFRAIDYYAKNVDKDYEYYFNSFKPTYELILKNKSLSRQKREKNINEYTQLFFKTAIKDYLEKIHSDMNTAQKELQDLQNEAHVFAREMWGTTPVVGNDGYFAEKVHIDIPESDSDENWLLIFIGGLLFPLVIVYYVFTTEIGRLKDTISREYADFFSLKEPKKKKKNWKRYGGFFYQVKNKIKFPYWDDFWKEFEKRFQIIGG